MKAGGRDAALFSGATDFQLLTVSGGTLKALATAGKVALCLDTQDVLQAKTADQRGTILSVGGADFLEEYPSHMQTVYGDGMRTLTLVCPS